jgi:hypothetical protein
MKLPKPKEGAAQYSGTFAAPAFRLFTGATTLSFHENLFAALAPFGARIDNLKVESGANPSITYELFPISGMVRIALDKIEIFFYSLSQVGVERARQLAVACWGAIHSAHDGIALAKHTLTVSYQFDLGSEGYKTLLETYVNSPKSLPPGTEPGIVFYFPPTGEIEEGSSIVLDRLSPGTLNLRVVMAVNGTKIAPEAMPDYADKHILGLIAKLGLEVEL